MRVAVAGATGVLGRALIPILLGQRRAVRALVRSTQKARTLFPGEVECVEYDLLALDPQARLTSRLQGCDAVLHIATAIPRDSAAPGAWDANTRLRTDGTRRLLDAALTAQIECYIQQSIVMAYPDRGDEWITEEQPLDTSPARASINAPVIAMEGMVRATSPQQLRWCILRGGTFVGRDTFQDDTIENLRAGRQIVLGDGRNFIAPIHVADMAQALAAALQHAPAGTIFNIVDEPIRAGAYVDRLASLIGAPLPQRDQSQSRPPSWRCSNAAARARLHWMPTHSIFPAS
jgi:nucleoside-diphosphate-sugar epimerase